MVYWLCMKCSPGSFQVFWSIPAHLDHLGLVQAFKDINSSNRGESAAHMYTTFYSGEISVDFERPYNTLQKCLFIGMSHTGHQNFRVCNPARGCDRVWFPPACVCQKARRHRICAGAQLGLRSRWACVEAWTGWMERVGGCGFMCVGVIPSVFRTCWNWVCLWLQVCMRISLCSLLYDMVK